MLGLPRFGAASGEQAVTRAECLDCLFLRDFFQYTRAKGYYMDLSTCADLSCASDKLCSLSAENSTTINLTQPGPHP